MKFLALFLLIPLIEVAVFIKVGGSIGALWTVLLTIGTALLGATLVRLQGMATLFNVKQQLMQGQLPAGAVVEGVILLVCGALLLTPGFITDTLGFLGLIPAVRQHVAKNIVQQVLVNQGRQGQASGFQGNVYDHQGHTSQRQGDGFEARGPKTLEGEWRRED